jgi:hypothetical protein
MTEIRDFGPFDYADMTPEQQDAVRGEVRRMAKAMYQQCLYVRPMWVVAEAAGMLNAMVAFNCPDPAEREAAINDIREYAREHLPYIHRTGPDKKDDTDAA